MLGNVILIPNLETEKNTDRVEKETESETESETEQETVLEIVVGIGINRFLHRKTVRGNHFRDGTKMIKSSLHRKTTLAPCTKNDIGQLRQNT